MPQLLQCVVQCARIYMYTRHVHAYNIVLAVRDNKRPIMEYLWMLIILDGIFENRRISIRKTRESVEQRVIIITVIIMIILRTRWSLDVLMRSDDTTARTYKLGETVSVYFVFTLKLK
jgi:hypothetical protein